MKRKFISLLSTLAASVTLASCSGTLYPNLPTDYNNGVLTVTDSEGNEVDVAFNYDRAYYDDIGGINATAVNSILDYIASELTQGHIADEDGNTLSLYSSEADEDPASVYELSFISSVGEDHTFEYSTYQYVGVSKEITERTQQAMVDMVSDGSYDYLNVFDEMQFALSLNANSLAQLDTSLVQNTLDKGVVVNSTSDFADIFTPNMYSDYINRSQAPTVIENMLTAQYIYNERYSSIVNADFRNVSIAALTDRDDRQGSAQALINAYYADYLSQGKTIEAEYAAAPLEELSILWKGVDLTEAQQNWITESGLTEDNLYAGIEADVEKIHLDNPLLTDSDLQDEYTGSGAYSVEEGVRRAVNSLRKQDVYTEGLNQKDDLSDLPDSVSNQLFAANMDSVLTEVGSHKYITPASTVNNSGASSITIYDADSDTYYLAMVDDDDIYDDSHLGTKVNNEADPARRAMAMDVAYNMVGDSTYRTDSVVYWIKNLVGDGKLVVHNQSFYDYLESTYPDLFED